MYALIPSALVFRHRKEEKECCFRSHRLHIIFGSFCLKSTLTFCVSNLHKNAMKVWTYIMVAVKFYLHIPKSFPDTFFGITFHWHAFMPFLLHAEMCSLIIKYGSALQIQVLPQTCENVRLSSLPVFQIWIWFQCAKKKILWTIKRNLEKHLIYEAKISQHSLYMFKLCAIKFLHKLEMIQQKIF